MALLAAFNQGVADVVLALPSLGEPSVTTNITFGLPERSWAVLPAPVLIPAAVGVVLFGVGSPLTAVSNVDADTKPEVLAVPVKPLKTVRAKSPFPSPFS
jgi:hypothetical protein